MSVTTPEQRRTESGLVRAPWIILVVLGGLALVARLTAIVGPLDSADSGGAGKDDQPPASRQIHYVSPAQVIATNGMSGQMVTDITAETVDGARLNWRSLSTGLPVVLVFAKRGCPCNDEFEPFFQRVEQLYRGSVRFAVVIDGDADAARTYADLHSVPYPVLPDPNREMIRRFEVENGGYFVLMGSDGVIDGFWPGCSAESLADLGRRIARHTNGDELPLDTRDMPRPLLTGCPYLK
jgi:peroxiredoxin